MWKAKVRLMMKRRGRFVTRMVNAVIKTFPTPTGFLKYNKIQDSDGFHLVT